MSKVVWKDRKRRGTNTQSRYYTRYGIGADVYVDGKKIGGVSHSGCTWWFVLKGKQSSYFATKELAQAALEKAI